MTESLLTSCFLYVLCLKLFPRGCQGSGACLPGVRGLSGVREKSAVVLGQAARRAWGMHANSGHSLQAGRQNQGHPHSQGLCFPRRSLGIPNPISGPLAPPFGSEMGLGGTACSRSHPPQGSTQGRLPFPGPQDHGWSLGNLQTSQARPLGGPQWDHRKTLWPCVNACPLSATSLSPACLWSPFPPPVAQVPHAALGRAGWR